MSNRLSLTPIVMAYDELKTTKVEMTRRAMESVEIALATRRQAFNKLIFDAVRSGNSISSLANTLTCSRTTIYRALEDHKALGVDSVTGGIYFEKDPNHGWGYTFVCKDYDFTHLGGGVVPLSGTLIQNRDAKPGEPQWKATADEPALKELMLTELRTEGSILRTEWEAFKEREGLE